MKKKEKSKLRNPWALSQYHNRFSFLPCLMYQRAKSTNSFFFYFSIIRCETGSRLIIDVPRIHCILVDCEFQLLEYK